MSEGRKLSDSPPTVCVTVERGKTVKREYSFTQSFNIGRGDECDIQIDDNIISRIHVEVDFEEGCWWVRDLNSANGTYVEGKKIESVPLREDLTIELGESGPLISLSIEELELDLTDAQEDPSVTQYVNKYFGELPQPGATEQTMFIRRAFERVQKKTKLKYYTIIAVIAFLLLITGSYAIFQHGKIQRQKQTASELFHKMKEQELRIAQLTEAEKAKHAPTEISQEYNQLVDKLGYRRKKSMEDRLIYRIARIFGECEVNLPKAFAREVKKYIKKWHTDDTFVNAIKRAQDNNYTTLIVRELEQQGLAPQFFYIALQESAFRKEACGPPTRFGYAKGMWQFIPGTARRYDLQVGPLVNFRKPDPEDERHNFRKSTKAAARYIRYIYETDAQASGLLVIASYNWGERRVVELINRMPKNPRDRNFWRLMEEYRNQIPKQTYDYVFRIFSAAVIGENPRHFEYDFDNPLGRIRGSSSR